MGWKLFPSCLSLFSVAICHQYHQSLVFSHDWTKNRHNLSSSFILLLLFFSYFSINCAIKFPSLQGLEPKKKWKGDKGQGQTVEERKFGMTLQLETYTKFYLLEISLWSSSAEGNTAKHLQYWKPGKCIPWKKAREPKFLLLAKNRSYICCKMCVKKGSRKKSIAAFSWRRTCVISFLCVRLLSCNSVIVCEVIIQTELHMNVHT